MKKFIDCLNDNQSFDARVAGSATFSPWSPGDRIPTQGKRFLIGVATYSALDLLLLDELECKVLKTPRFHKTIDLFKVTDCQTPGDFERYIPGLYDVFQTPVVGLWDQGIPTLQASGREARDLIGRHYGISRKLNKIVNHYYEELTSKYYEGFRTESLKAP